jgi:hypothetical protein
MKELQFKNQRVTRDVHYVEEEVNKQEDLDSMHLEFGKQWNVIIFFMFSVKKRVRIFNTKTLYGNDT